MSKIFLLKVALAQEKIVALESCITRLTDEVDDLENRSCGNNLVIYGRDEWENETEELRDRLQDVLR